MAAVNLYFTPEGKTALRYRLTTGERRERTVDFPSALLTQPAEPEAEVNLQPLHNPEAALFAAFRAIPLRPDAPWTLTESPDFSPLYRETFAALLRMMRLPPEQRWCRRGEPGRFLQFGFREKDGSYTMGAFILPCGKPAVLTFRAEDLITALPPDFPFATMEIRSVADGLPEQIDPEKAWDTRIRLPIADRGAALITLRPQR